MDPAIEVDASASLFEVIEKVIQHDYVLVRSQDRWVTGLVASIDVSRQLLQLTVR